MKKCLKVPLDDVLSDKVFLAYQVNGEVLPRKHGFPLARRGRRLLRIGLGEVRLQSDSGRCPGVKFVNCRNRYKHSEH